MYIQYRNRPEVINYSDLFSTEVDAQGRFEIRGLIPTNLVIRLPKYDKEFELRGLHGRPGIVRDAPPRT